MIVIKGSKVEFTLKDGRTFKLPRDYGMIHDPDGAELNRCTFYFASYAKTGKPAKKTSRKATRYFGKKYVLKETRVTIPEHGWTDIGEAVEIRYERTKGSQYAAKYFHVFKKRSPMLSRSGRCYRLELKDGCVVDDRGFVMP